MSGRTDDPATWIEIAHEDIRVAELAAAENPPLVRSVIFHSQQAAEKFLKAFLVARNADFPRTHDLEFLLDRCAQLDPSLAAFETYCQRLWGVGVSTRYPGFPTDHLTEETAVEAVALAHRIRDGVLPKV